MYKGTGQAEPSYSPDVNKLVQLGLMFYKSKGKLPSFDLRGLQRELMKIYGSREGIAILTGLNLAIYLTIKVDVQSRQLAHLISANITAINNEELAENRFISPRVVNNKGTASLRPP